MKKYCFKNKYDEIIFSRAGVSSSTVATFYDDIWNHVMIILRICYTKSQKMSYKSWHMIQINFEFLP